MLSTAAAFATEGSWRMMCLVIATVAVLAGLIAGGRALARPREVVSIAQRIDRRVHGEDAFVTWVTLPAMERSGALGTALGERVDRLSLGTNAAEIVPIRVPRRVWLLLLLAIGAGAIALVRGDGEAAPSIVVKQDPSQLADLAVALRSNDATRATASTLEAAIARGDVTGAQTAIRTAQAQLGGDVSDAERARAAAAVGLEAALTDQPLLEILGGSDAATQLRSAVAESERNETTVAEWTELVQRLDTLADTQSLGAPSVAESLRTAAESLRRGDTAGAATALDQAAEAHEANLGTVDDIALRDEIGATAAEIDTDQPVPVGAGGLSPASQDLVRDYFRLLAEDP